MQRFLASQQAVAGRFLSTRSGAALPAARRAIPAVKPPLAPVPCARYVMKGEPVSLPAPVAGQRLAGLYLVSGETGPILDAVMEGMRSHGACAEPVTAAALQNLQNWTAALGALRERHGPVRGIVHLAGLGADPMPATLELWQTANQAAAKNLFHLLQSCESDLQTAGRCFALSSLDGAFGRRSGVWHGSAGSAACAGLLKTAALEWPQFGVKAIDLDTATPEYVRSVVLAELFSPDTAQEIGYREGTRSVYQAILEPFPAADPSQALAATPAADWVVLATGGARGITAETIKAFLVPGLTLALIGRAPEPTEEGPLTRDLKGAPAMRAAFLQQAKAAGQMCTPAQIEKQISALQRDRAIRGNLDAFRRLGVRVEYHAADVRDAEAFGAIIDSLYARHGRIDAVFHGAGVIEDKLLADKSPESFDRVFGTKADSMFVLAKKLRPEALRWLILFASVAGRTGNRGQSDYAVANELVNRCAWWLHYKWPSVVVKSFNWGPWESGMASDEVNRQFRERGVIPIPTLAGREFVLRALRDDPQGEVELIAGIFDFDIAEAASFLRHQAPAPATTSPRPVS